jgi:hypothetical protein
MVGYSLAQNSGFQLGSRGSNSQSTHLSLLDMLKAYAAGFYRVAIELQELRVRARFGTSDTKVHDHTLNQFHRILELIKEECKNLGLDHTLKMTEGIEGRCLLRTVGTMGIEIGIRYTENDLLSDLDTLEMSFRNELRGELIFRIAPDKNRYFEKDDLFGSEVANAFPSAADNIRNAGTCFAVEQWDASVFHLMRVLERGLRVMAIRFNVSFQNATWNTIIQDVETSIGGMSPSFGADWREQRTFYSEAARHFRFLKDAWRNHIMHLGDDYDEGKALSVLRHVHELMQTLVKGGLHE